MIKETSYSGNLYHHLFKFNDFFRMKEEYQKLDKQSVALANYFLTLISHDSEENIKEWINTRFNEKSFKKLCSKEQENSNVNRVVLSAYVYSYFSHLLSESSSIQILECCIGVSYNDSNYINQLEHLINCVSKITVIHHEQVN